MVRDCVVHQNFEFQTNLPQPHTPSSLISLSFHCVQFIFLEASVNPGSCMSLFLFFSLPSRTSAADVYEFIAFYYTCFYGRIAGGPAGSTCKACIVCPAGIFNFCAFSNFKILHFVTLCNFIAKMNSVPWATAHLIGVSTHLTYIRHRDIIAQQTINYHFHHTSLLAALSIQKYMV